MKSARRIAAEALIKIDNDASYSSLTLNSFLSKETLLSAKDSAFVTRIVYGVIERRITLDYNLALYLKDPIKKLRPNVLACLRMGAYQILFSDKIPDRAAVNESVALSKELGVSYASGMMNAVLRKISANGLCLPDESQNAALYLSVKYSCPVPLLTHFLIHYGREKTEQHLAASLSARPLFIRRNTLLCTEEMLISSLTSSGVSVVPDSLNGCYVLNTAGDITRLEAYKKGWFHVQDRSSQLAVMLLGARPSQTVVDCCAAPGGKSFTAAQYMENTGTLYSCDMYAHKTVLIENGAKRLGIRNITVLCEDAAQLYKRNIVADAVLCDVPCSGYGVIGRKPEIRYKDPAQFLSLPETQYAILCSGARMVKPGGTLLYSTCTLNPAENEDVCRRFLSEHADFTISIDPVYRAAANGDYLTVFASDQGGDGFFAARFERNPI